MKLTRILAALAAFATMALLFATPVSAQATRTWVSGVGDDVNPCSRTAPCKTFAGAFSKTATGGEINCLDPGGFGNLTITKAITIDCSSTLGGVLVGGATAFVINITTGDTHVQLIGLDIDGLGANGTTSGNGINVLTAANVLVKDCLIYGFRNADGLDGTGVLLGAVGAKAIIVNSTIRQNTVGVRVGASGAVAQIDNSTLDANITSNLDMRTAGAKAFLNRSTLTGSAAITNTVAASVQSTGTNFIVGVGSPTATIALQ